MILSKIRSWFKKKLRKSLVYSNYRRFEETTEREGALNSRIKQLELEKHQLTKQLQETAKPTFTPSDKEFKQVLLDIGTERFSKKRMDNNDLFVGVFALVLYAFVDMKEKERLAQAEKSIRPPTLLPRYSPN